MKLLLLSAFWLLTAATCRERGTSVAETTDYDKSKHTVYIDAKGNHYVAFSDIPDSLLTADGKIQAKALKAVMEDGVVVENNKLVLKISKENNLAKGKTEKDYDDLKSKLNDYNSHYDSTGNDRVAAMIDDMKRGYKSH